MVFARGTNGFRRQLPSRLIDPDGGVGALVRIDPDDHHGGMSPAQVAGGWTGRSAYPSRGDATLLSSQVGRSLWWSASRKTDIPRRRNNGRANRPTRSIVTLGTSGSADGASSEASAFGHEFLSRGIARVPGRSLTLPFRARGLRRRWPRRQVAPVDHAGQVPSRNVRMRSRCRSRE